MVIDPIGNGIFIEEVKEESEVVDMGGIFMPNLDTFKDKTATVFKGKVISIGIGMLDKDGNKIIHSRLSDIKIGDIVICKPSGGTYITGKNRKKYKIEDVDEILAIITE